MAESYPINIIVNPYRGKDRRKLFHYQEKLRISRQIVEYLNHTTTCLPTAISLQTWA